MSKFLKNTSIYTIGNILPQAASFILLPIYTRYMTPADYGITNSLQVLSTVLSILFTLAIERSVYRLYFDFKTEKDKRDYLGTITIAVFFISLIVTGFIFIFRGVVSQIYESIPFYPYYVYAILIAFFSTFQILPKIYFQVNQKANKYVLISIALFVLNVLFTLWFVVENNEGAIGMLKAGFCSSIVIAPVVIYISCKTINFRFKRALFIESLKFSIPMLPSLLSAFVLNLSDRVFIENYFSLADVGIYSLGYKIAGVLGLLAGAFLSAYTPVFYKFANSENQLVAKEKLAKYNHVFIVGVISMAFFITLFSKEAILFLLDAKYINAYKIIPIITFCYMLTTVSGLLNCMIYQKKSTAKLMLIQLVGAGLSILANFLLIPQYGMYGAAFATLISFVILFILTFKHATNCYYVPFYWKKILTLLIPLVMGAIFFQYILTTSIYWMIVLKIIFCGVLIFYFYKKYYPQFKTISYI